MITEQDIRGIYDGFYKIAETYGDLEVTNNLANQMDNILGDGRILRQLRISVGKPIKTSSDYLEAQNLMKGLNKEFSGLRELSRKQLEAQVQK